MKNATGLLSTRNQPTSLLSVVPLATPGPDATSLRTTERGTTPKKRSGLRSKLGTGGFDGPRPARPRRLTAFFAVPAPAFGGSAKKNPSRLRPFRRRGAFTRENGAVAGNPGRTEDLRGRVSISTGATLGDRRGLSRGKSRNSTPGVFSTQVNSL